MSRKFVSKKRRRKRNLIKYILIFFLMIIIYEVLSALFLNIRLASSNEEFLKLLLKDSNHHVLYEKSNNNIANKFMNMVTNIDIKTPVSILENTFGFKQKKEKILMYSHGTTDSDSQELLDKNSKYINDTIGNDNKEPVVYIYNTHQLESYSSKNLEEHNITPNVMMASYILREKLNNKNIPTLVETNNITDFLNTNGWNYSSSYKASRYYLKETLNNHKNLKLIIDLHRDSISKKASTVTIDGKNYAKVLFVVGLEHKNYKKNLETVNKINEILKKKYPTLSRGIIKKSGKNINGIYNQDLSEKIILIECGGKDNKIDEVLNTLEILAEVIEEYLGG